MDPKHVIATVDAYLAGVASSDVDAVVALFAEDATVEDPVGTDPHRGRDAIRAFYTNSLAVPMTAERDGQVRIAGQEAAFAFRLEIPMAGMVMNIIDVFRFDAHGKIASMRAFWGPTNAGRL